MPKYAKYFKLILNIILLAAVVLWQLSFINGLPAPFDKLNLILVILILVLVFNGAELALWWAAGCGLALDSFSFSPFGLEIISLVLTVLLANWLLEKFFTNRSLYSLLALTSLAAIFYNCLLIFYYCILNFFNQFGDDFSLTPYLAAILWQLVLNSLITVVIFYTIHFISRSLKPV